MTRKTRDVVIVAVSMAAITTASQYALCAIFGTGVLAGFWAGGALFLVADAWGSSVRRKYERGQ